MKLRTRFAIDMKILWDDVVAFASDLWSMIVWWLWPFARWRADRRIDEKNKAHAKIVQESRVNLAKLYEENGLDQKAVEQKRPKYKGENFNEISREMFANLEKYEPEVATAGQVCFEMIASVGMHLTICDRKEFFDQAGALAWAWGKMEQGCAVQMNRK